MSESVPAFHPVGHERHAPRMDYSEGVPGVPAPEVPGRLDGFREGFARAWPLDVVEVSERAEDAVRRLHDADYVDYLLGMENRIAPDAELVPSLFRADMARAPERLRMGMYCTEIGTPLLTHTVDAALRSARCAERAAEAVVAGADRAVALCRPPGHHAGHRRYGGYCYFNNAYVAANVLTAARRRCAVVDIDYHLGDGSMEFAHEAASYHSLHADPFASYPYLDPASVPKGDDVELIAVPPGADLDTYDGLLSRVCDGIDARGVDAVIVSLGLDTVVTDPIQDSRICLQVADYQALGQRFAQLGKPVLIVVEGGYDLGAIAACAEAFATGLGRG